MSVLPQLERDLVEAARCHLAGADVSSQAHRSLTSRRARLRAVRMPLVALGALLASTTIALAATGVILTGAPVRPSDQRNPRVGMGVPVPGGSRLLPLRVADPEGGLPWGMRLVRTTRGELCLEVGRVQNEQLGLLGLDGAFGGDGRFHPMPASALPAISPVGLQPEANANTSCQLVGKAVIAEHIGLDRSAAGFSSHQAHQSRRAFRDIYYGILGPAAVSITYRLAGRRHTAPVLPGSGAYLIVARSSPHDQLGYGGASIGTYGDLPPSGALSAVTYRIAGRLCRRGPVMPPWIHHHIADQCPTPHWPRGGGPTRDLHRPIHARLVIHHGLVWGLDLSFSAPFAIDNARHEYSAAMSICQFGRTQIGGARLINRDIARGETVDLRFSHPFSTPGCSTRTLTIDVRYNNTEGAGSVIVGRVNVHLPPGMRPAPLPQRILMEPRVLRRLARRHAGNSHSP